MSSIQIIGAGAIGSFLSASFIVAGHRTIVVARGERLARLREKGLLLRRGVRQIHVSPAVVPDLSGVRCPDLAVLCVKSNDLGAALDLLNEYAERPPVIVTVQNGVDAPDQVADRFPAAVVLASRVHGFFEMVGGDVRHVAVEPSLLFGRWKGEDADACALFSKALNSAAIKNSIADDIECALWEKLLLVSSISGVGTALAIPAGQVIRDSAGRNMLTAAMAEVALLAGNRGIHLPDDCVETTLDFVAAFPADATSSLQRDMEAHLPSEFDQLIGAVMRMAAENGLEMPVHRGIVQKIAERGLL